MVHVTHATAPIKEKEITRDWYLVDASSKPLGRMISETIRYLEGKHKITYVPYLDMGDYVVVINAKNVVLSGRKDQQKVYTHFSGYPGGLKTVSFQKMKEKKPTEIIRRAVSGMLPKNKLKKKRLARLFIFPDENHPYKEKIKRFIS